MASWDTLVKIGDVKGLQDAMVSGENTWFAFKQIVDDGGNNALHIACASKSIKMIIFLIDVNVEWLEISNKRGETPFLLSCLHCDLPAVQYIQNKISNIKQKDFKGRNALHHAIKGGNLEVVKYLLIHGFSPRTTNYKGLSGILIGFKEGHLNLSKYLLSQGSSLKEVGTKNGFACLHAASYSGSKECIDFLLKNNHNLNQRTYSGESSIMFAAQNGKTEMLQYLANKGCSLDNTEDYGISVIAYAAEKGRTDTVKHLHRKGCDIHQVSAEDNTSLLYRAARSGNSECFQYLLEQGCSLDVCKSDRFTMMHAVAKGGNLELAKLLLSHGFTGKETNIVGTSVFCSAVAGGNIEFVRFLVETIGCSPLCTDESGFTALHHAAQEKSMDMISFLIGLGCSIHAKSDTEITVLHSALAAGNIPVVHYLIENGCSLFDVDVEGYGMIHAAAESGCVDLMDFLVIEKKLDVLATYGSINDINCISIAAEWGSLELFRYLLPSGFDLTVFNEYGNNLFDIAAAGGKIGILQYILDENLLAIDEQDIWWAVCSACAGGHLEATKFLLARGAISANDNFTFVNRAVSSGHMKCIKYFVEEHGCSVHSLCPNAELNCLQNAFRPAISSINREKVIQYIVERAYEENPESPYGIECLRYCIQDDTLFHLIEWMIYGGWITFEQCEKAVQEGTVESREYLQELKRRKCIKRVQ